MIQNNLCISSDIVSTLYSESLTTDEGIEKCEKAANELQMKIETDINDGKLNSFLIYLFIYYYMCII